VAQTGLILDRMAAAIRDSGSFVDPEATITGACGADETLCAIDLPGAAHNGAWRSFRAWAQTTLSLGPATLPPIVAGVASPPLQLSAATAVGRPVTVTLRSSSSAGTFATSVAGPWLPALAVSVSPGAVASFHYRDTRAGTATLTASAPGTNQAAREINVIAGAATRVSVSPGSREVRARGDVMFAGVATDAFGNPVPSSLAWSVNPPTLGAFVRGQDGTATFHAGRVLGSGVVTARRGSLAGSATVVVRPATLRVAATFRATSRGAHLTLTAADTSRRPVSAAALTFAVRLDKRRVARSRAITGAAGKARLNVPAGAGCYAVVVTRAAAQGFTWDGRTPRSRLCRR
jgi:hypothetical protein